MPLEPGSLRSQPIADLIQTARASNVENASSLRKQDLVAAILRESGGTASEGTGVLEILPDGFGFLRAPEYSFLPGADDVYVSPSQIRRFNLRTGDLVGGQVRAPKENERYFALIKVERINGAEPDVAREKVLFENLTPVWPRRPLLLGDPALRLLSAVAPIGFGQRVVVAGPPRSGRTSLLRRVAQDITRRQPSVVLLLVLVGERPEEVTELERALPGLVLATTFDEPDARHVQVAEMAIERAKRLVEHGKDVVVLFDSLDRLSRAASLLDGAGGGACDPTALLRIRRMLGAARALEEGGSLTLIATLEESPEVPAVLAEAVRNAANCAIRLDPASGPGGIWPALDLARTRTLREELLLGQAGVTRARALRAAGDGSLAAATAQLDKVPAPGE